MCIFGLIQHLMSINHIRNLWVLSISTLIEFVLIISMFFFWKTKERDRILLALCVCLFVSFWLVSKFTFEPFSAFDSFTSTTAKMIYIVIATTVLFDIQKDSKTRLKTDARVWFASGLIIYSVVTLLMFALFNVMLKESPNLVKTIWPFNWLIFIIANLFYARAIWCPGDTSA
jgi:hypothetical protein